MTDKNAIGKKNEGNIALVGFGSLEPMELDIISKIAGAYAGKLQERGNYVSMRLVLHSHKHAQSFIHELKAEAYMKKGKGATSGKEIILSASITDRNLFSALSEVMEMLLHEAEHKLRTSEDVVKDMLRNQKKNKRRLEE